MQVHPISKIRLTKIWRKGWALNIELLILTDQNPAENAL